MKEKVDLRPLSLSVRGEKRQGENLPPLPRIGPTPPRLRLHWKCYHDCVPLRDSSVVRKESRL